YLMSQMMSPLPWLNGKSFMLSASTFGNGKNDAAIQWMETINRLQPQSTISLRKLNYVTNSNSVQALLTNQFENKLNNHQLFFVDRYWISSYTELQRQWRQHVTLQQKLALFLESS